MPPLCQAHIAGTFLCASSIHPSSLRPAHIPTLLHPPFTVPPRAEFSSPPVSVSPPSTRISLPFCPFCHRASSSDPSTPRIFLLIAPYSTTPRHVAQTTTLRTHGPRAIFSSPIAQPRSSSVRSLPHRAKAAIHSSSVSLISSILSCYRPSRYSTPLPSSDDLAPTFPRNPLPFLAYLISLPIPPHSRSPFALPLAARFLFIFVHPSSTITPLNSFSSPSLTTRSSAATDVATADLSLPKEIYGCLVSLLEARWSLGTRSLTF
ncbi:hypothetical protein B0H13DRAFT_2315416 [Mycena leptocephala]|nr:hypothetical protein B0H13DRAFT_2315416 [Mycena leptocephala]